jgi:hypothetical protein
VSIYFGQGFFSVIFILSVDKLLYCLGEVCLAGVAIERYYEGRYAHNRLNVYLISIFYAFYATKSIVEFFILLPEPALRSVPVIMNRKF